MSLGAFGMLMAVLTGDQDPVHGGAMLFFAAAYIGGLGAAGVLAAILLVSIGRWTDGVPGLFAIGRWRSPILVLATSVCGVFATFPLSLPFALMPPGSIIMPILWGAILLAGIGSALWIGIATWHLKRPGSSDSGVA
jgi:hypothetical protein